MDEDDPDFMCPFCTDVVNNVVSCRDGHSFCEVYIILLRKAVERKVERLRVETNHGCEWIGKLGEREAHLNNDCLYSNGIRGT